MDDPLDFKERLVTILDAEVAPGGWNQQHKVIGIEPAGADDFELLIQVLPEGMHPIEMLDSFIAPMNWVGIGVIAFGWASPPCDRPSQHAERKRVRCTTFVWRDGDITSTAALDDGTVIDQPGTGGVINAMTECLARS